LNLYKGYVPTSGKRPTIPFKDRPSSELLTLEAAQRYPEYAAVLNTNAVLVDIDDYEQSEILFNIVKQRNLKCKVTATNRGKHFLFRADKPFVKNLNRSSSLYRAKASFYTSESWMRAEKLNSIR
jgi:putative DNA primase/helicase